MPLIPCDEKFLNQNGYEHETHEVSGHTLLIIKNYVLPIAYYIPNVVSLLVKIPPGYPMTPLDMFWVYPEVRLVNGNRYPQSADVFEDNLGIKWQRFSRHYQWRSGIDSLQSHLIAISRVLKKAS